MTGHSSVLKIWSTIHWRGLYAGLNCLNGMDVNRPWFVLHELLHCFKTKSYIAQKSVNIHSGPDSKVMHRFTTRMPFFQSSVMMMDTSPAHRIWHAKARYARVLTVPSARVIHIPPAQQTGLSLAG